MLVSLISTSLTYFNTYELVCFQYDSISFINYDSRIFVNKHETREKHEEILIHDTNTINEKTRLYIHDP